MTGKYKETDKMSDLICDDYRLLQVLTRFGLTFGFGDQTVSAACAAQQVDVPTFLAVVNFVTSGGRIDAMALAENISVEAMTRYLEHSHTYFTRFRVPAIRRKLIESIDCSARNQIAFLILKFYDEFALEVSRHMDYEDQYIHTYVRQLLGGKLPSSSEQTNIDSLEERHRENHIQIEKSLSELKSIIIKYYPNDSKVELLNEVLMDLYILEEDLEAHCLMEDEVYIEAVRRLEVECALKASDTNESDDLSGTGEGNSGNTDTLSEREREVIVCVVRGLSNKEIAEKLFISVNTVMTHRRNISRKLQIHSPAGLTIYAIVNGLINLDEVKL